MAKNTDRFENKDLPFEHGVSIKDVRPRGVKCRENKKGQKALVFHCIVIFVAFIAFVLVQSHFGTFRIILPCLPWRARSQIGYKQK